MTMDLKQALKGRLKPEEIPLVSKSFDIVGDIGIIELDESLKKKERAVAEALMRVHRHIKTVCAKSGERGGRLRLRKLEKVMGNGFETVHTESGCRYKLDVRKAYFSPRESTERKRVADQVKAGETVLVMFSGIAPYAVMIAKTQKGVEKVSCIELNRDACRYAEENVKMNKVADKIEIICGDVGKESKRFRGLFDRVVMPAPTEAYRYLDDAVACVKNGGVVHFYFIGHEDDLYSECEDLVRESCGEVGKKFKILRRKKVLPYAPRIWKVCLDVEVR
jgi:tRNA (guanine37-N1)-methyltransferase